jgi:NAD(P)H-hydrate epimerase
MKLARAHQTVVVLKGHRTVVCDGRGVARVYVNQTGNPALAVAGSGDVLTGLLAALLAQGTDRFEAAVLATYLHGLAGDLWARRYGPSGLTARDLAALLPEAMQRHHQHDLG